MSPDDVMQITEAMRQEARQNPNGWVYVISSSYVPDGAIPPHAIVGAWKVDGRGEVIEDSFQKNPNYRP